MRAGGVGNMRRGQEMMRHGRGITQKERGAWEMLRTKALTGGVTTGEEMMSRGE